VAVVVVRETTVVVGSGTADVEVRGAAVVGVETTVVEATGMSEALALDRTWWAADPRVHPAISTRPNATMATGSPFRTRAIVAAGLTEVDYRGGTPATLLAPVPGVPRSQRLRLGHRRCSVWGWEFEHDPPAARGGGRRDTDHR
jgi:hypothetical protein